MHSPPSVVLRTPIAPLISKKAAVITPNIQERIVDAFLIVIIPLRFLSFYREIMQE